MPTLLVFALIIGAIAIASRSRAGVTKPIAPPGGYWVTDSTGVKVVIVPEIANKAIEIIKGAKNCPRFEVTAAIDLFTSAVVLNPKEALTKLQENINKACV